MGRIKSFLLSHFQINYIYFGFVFFVLSFIHIYHVCLIENGSFAFRGYFIFYALGESFLEVVLLVIANEWIKRFFPRYAHYCFIVFTFFLCLVHFIDFFLVRLMDISLWYAMEFVLDETLENFQELLMATHVSITTWIMGGILAIALVLTGLLFFHLTEKLSQRKAIFLTHRSYLAILLISPFLFLLGSQIFKEMASSSVSVEYQKVLPLKDTFMASTKQVIPLPADLKEPAKEDEVLKTIQRLDLPNSNQPDIFLFVIESLREDFLTAEISPELRKFKNENLSTPISLSGANGTQISWFSIFFSKFPFYFHKIGPSQWKKGSPGLQILKKLGYSIEVLSSVRLSYYQMDKLIFGEGKKLANIQYFFPYGTETKPCQSDQMAIAKLIESVKQKEPGGRCFIIFLESTHFDYSWPDKTFVRFKPTTEKINYLSILFSKKDLEKIKNRYRNAIYFVDALFGKFTEALKERGIWDNSVIVVTGDHGEEFYEQGHLFHASNLNTVQTSVPIYYKLGNNADISPGAMSSHIDIFPTIFHYLLKDENLLANLFDGESIYRKSRFPYVISSRFNAGRTPYELSIHNGEYKLLARFLNKNKVFRSRKLQILDTKDNIDIPVIYSLQKIEHDFSKAFEKICNP